MSDLKTQFEQAVADSKNLPERPDSGTLLKLYALYKQATVGDVDGKRPASATWSPRKMGTRGMS